MRKIVVFLSVCAAFTTIPRHGLAQNNRVEPPVTVNPGDFIRLSVWKNPDYDGEFEIASDSTIRHPLYRVIKAGGLTVGEVEQRLMEYLKTWLADPRIVVESRLRVSVGGAVEQPNVYSVAPDVTVARAIMLAGGPSEDAEMDKVLVIRGRNEMILDLSSPTSQDRDVRIRSGDQIILKRDRSILREIVGPISSVMSFTLLALTLYLRIDQN